MVRAVIRVPAYGHEEAAAAPAAAPAPRSFEGRASSGGARLPSALLAAGARPPPHHHAAPPPGVLFSKVPSLVFDMEDTEDAPGGGLGAAGALGGAGDGAPAEEVAARVAALLAPATEAEAALLTHVRLAREDAERRGRPHLTVPELAATLSRCGYAVRIRAALGGGWGGACLRNLRHSFLTAAPPGGGGAPALVDPRFREQFEIAHATPRYAAVLRALAPEAVVAPPERLAPAVELLCAEMARAFAETGTPLPPWRARAAMLSKWAGRQEDVDAAAAERLGAAAAALNNAAGEGEAARAAVAQKLALLGVDVGRAVGAPAAAAAPLSPAPPSPISEGYELDGDLELDGDPAGWPSPTTDGAGAGGSPAAPRRAAAPPSRPPGEGIWEGIRAAAAALPGRRSHTWA